MDAVGFCLLRWVMNAKFACTYRNLIQSVFGLPRQVNMQERERWLSVEEIAAHLGVNRDTIYKWIAGKQMPAHKLGKLWKFKATEIGTRRETRGVGAVLGQTSRRN